MKNCLTIYTAVAAMVVATGCAMTQARDDTKSVGLLIKSVANTAETFQKQRDLIAVAELRNRYALERMSTEFEGSTAMEISVWELSGQTERKRMFDGLRQASEKVQAARAEHDKRAEEQVQALAKAHSAVSFQTGKLNQAAAGLVKLGEPRSMKEEVEFLAGFIESVRSDIAKKNEEAAKKVSSQAEASLKSKGVQ